MFGLVLLDATSPGDSRGLGEEPYEPNFQNKEPEPHFSIM